MDTIRLIIERPLGYVLFLVDVLPLVWPLLLIAGLAGYAIARHFP